MTAAIVKDPSRFVETAIDGDDLMPAARAESMASRVKV